MRDIYLHGALGKRHGRHFELEVETPAEAVRALCMVVPGIRADLLRGEWQVVLGRDVEGKARRKTEGGLQLADDVLAGLHLGASPLHIAPAFGGAKDGAVKAILGVALIGISFGFAGALSGAIAPALFGATTWGNAIGMLGLSLAVNGVSTMIAGETPTEESTDSFLLKGPTNVSAQGAVVPLVYGEVITGGLLVSSALDIQSIDQSGNATTTSQTILDAKLGAPNVTVL